MLTKIRNSSNNFFIKIILALIAFSFIGIGGASFITSGDRGNMVSFDKTESISKHDFELAKAKEIQFLQRQNSINLTEENIQELNLDNSVLRKLINQSMIKYLAYCYDFDISDNMVTKYIKNLDLFKNENGDFDINIFKNTFHNSFLKEAAYIKLYKHQLVSEHLMNIFMNSFMAPKIMLDNIASYMAETRIVDLISIDLLHKPDNYEKKLLSKQELEDFYYNNRTLFVVPELRSFEYIKVDRNFMEKKLKFSELDLENFFENNKNDFYGQDYNEAKEQVKEIFISEKLAELTNEFANNLEEDVSFGLNFTEIAKKYQLNILAESNLSLSDMNSNDSKNYIEIADTVFEMQTDEISYPIEMIDTNEIILVYLKDIKHSKQKSFDEAQKDIEKLMKNKALSDFNMNYLKEFAHTYNTKIRKDNFKKHGITFLESKSFSKTDMHSQEKFPSQLLNSIFTTKKNKLTNAITYQGKTYVAYVKNIHTDQEKVDAIMKDYKDNLKNVIRESLMQELILYLAQQNNMKISDK